MSRMTKFLKQKCQVSPYQLDENGEPLFNRFGELVYEEPTEHKCRYEPTVKDVQTANGAILRATSRYFLDESFELKADYKIDGKVILAMDTYINELGVVEGYEVYT